MLPLRPAMAGTAAFASFIPSYHLIRCLPNAQEAEEKAVNFSSMHQAQKAAPRILYFNLRIWTSGVKAIFRMDIPTVRTAIAYNRKAKSCPSTTLNYRSLLHCCFIVRLLTSVSKQQFVYSQILALAISNHNRQDLSSKCGNILLFPRSSKTNVDELWRGNFF